MTQNTAFSLCAFSSAGLPTKTSKGRAHVSELSRPSVPRATGMRAQQEALLPTRLKQEPQSIMQPQSMRLRTFSAVSVAQATHVQPSGSELGSVYHEAQTAATTGSSDM